MAAIAAVKGCPSFRIRLKLFRRVWYYFSLVLATPPLSLFLYLSLTYMHALPLFSACSLGNCTLVASTIKQFRALFPYSEFTRIIHTLRFAQIPPLTYTGRTKRVKYIRRDSRIVSRTRLFVKFFLEIFYLRSGRIDRFLWAKKGKLCLYHTKICIKIIFCMYMRH